MAHNIKVICLHCSHSIQLPEAATSDSIALLLACPSCGHVYGYNLPRFLPGLRFSACECGDSDCRFPVAVYTVLPAGIEAETELAIARRRARWIFHGATCPFGHPVGTGSDDQTSGFRV